MLWVVVVKDFNSLTMQTVNISQQMAVLPSVLTTFRVDSGQRRMKTTVLQQQKDVVVILFVVAAQMGVLVVQINALIQRMEVSQTTRKHQTHAIHIKTVVQ